MPKIIPHTYLRPLILPLLALSLIALAACGADRSLDEYREKMERFFAQIEVYDNAINALDPEADDAVEEMLAHLDGLAAAVKEMAGYKVPEDFIGVVELAGQAEYYMTEAVRLYREAYTAEEFDEETAWAALENYERANLRLRYIAEILRGNIPEGIFID
ncbi:MAG: hypothetical protein LBI54_05960 [Lachnospiraceae bacterium]|jgi:hypothetical protein|nr:hypothetical protein [Lachnospiraceae bacterium]